MLDFLKEQLANVEEELKQLYIDRSRAGVETVGSYEIMIDRKGKERQKLIDDIKRESGKANQTSTLPKAGTSKAEIINLISNGKLKKAINAMLEQGIENDVVLLSSRYNSITKQMNGGIISSEKYQIEINRITNSLLAILNGNA